jgi:hypothetical protein
MSTSLSLHGLPVAVLCPSTHCRLPLNWMPRGHSRIGEVPVSCYEARIPVGSVSGLVDFLAAACVRGLEPGQFVLLRAIGSPWRGFQFTLSGDLELRGDGVILRYGLRPQAMQVAEDVLTSLPALAPCRADDGGEAQVTATAARQRALQIAARWPEARLGLVTVCRRRQSSTTSIRCFFRGAGAALVGETRVDPSALPARETTRELVARLA